MSTSTPPPGDERPAPPTVPLNGNGPVLSARQRAWIAGVIVGVWASSIVVSIVLACFGREWSADPWVLATMFATAGAIFGPNFVRSIR